LLEVLRQNGSAVRERVHAACHAAGREPSSIRIIAVTKSVQSDAALALARLGWSELGENRASGLAEKAQAFRTADQLARWSFIGHLQRNKVRRVVLDATEIHSVDSLPLFQAIARVSLEEDRAPGVYLQVMLAHEENKHGFQPDDIPAAVEAAGQAPHLPLLGLMAMAPLSATTPSSLPPADAFRELAALARTLPQDAFAGGRPRLSMGMSGDLEAAIAAGADDLRIGSAFFAGLTAARSAPSPEDRP